MIAQDPKKANKRLLKPSSAIRRLFQSVWYYLQNPCSLFKSLLLSELASNV